MLGNQRVRALKGDLMSIGDLVEETVFKCCLSNYLTCEISHVGLEKREIHGSSSTLLTSLFLRQDVLEEGVNISDLVAPQLSLVMVCSETGGLQFKKEAVISQSLSPMAYLDCRTSPQKCD